jgi:hypothetical protein
MRSTGYILAVIVGLHLIVGLAYDWATPVLEASDEAAHYAVVNWLARGNPLPVQNPDGPETRWERRGASRRCITSWARA